MTSVPPHDLQAERVVLASVLFHGRDTLAVLPLSPEEFYRTGHRMIYETAQALDTSSAPVDLVTITQALHGSGKLEKVGGAAYLAQLTEAVSPDTAVYQAGVISDLAHRRRVISAAQSLAMQAYDLDQDLPECLTCFESAVVGRETSGVQKIGDSLQGAFFRLEELYGGKKPGIVTGLSHLDQAVQLCPGDLTVLAGRPGMGKTALGLTIAAGAAACGHCGLFVSLEMPLDQIENRLISQKGVISLHKFRSGEFTDSDWPKLTRAANDLKECPLWVDARPGLTLAQIRGVAAGLLRRHKLEFLVIDHLGKIRHADERATEYSRVTSIARGAKDLARSLSLPVVLLSQLSRRVEQRLPPVPNLGDLRDSGAIEEEADTVLMLYRQDYYVEQGVLDPNSAEQKKKGYFRDDLTGKGVVFLSKNRHGPTTRVTLQWEPQTATYSEVKWK